MDDNDDDDGDDDDDYPAMDVVRCLVEAWPGSLLAKGEGTRGWLPLHRACSDVHDQGDGVEDRVELIRSVPGAGLPRVNPDPSRGTGRSPFTWRQEELRGGAGARAAG